MSWKKMVAMIIAAALVITLAVLFCPRRLIKEDTVIYNVRLVYRGDDGNVKEVRLDPFDAEPEHDDLVNALHDIVCMRSLDLHTYSVNDVDYVLEVWTKDWKYVGVGVGKDTAGRDFRACWIYEHVLGHEYRILNYGKAGGALEAIVKELADKT